MKLPYVQGWRTRPRPAVHIVPSTFEQLQAEHYRLREEFFDWVYLNAPNLGRSITEQRASETLWEEELHARAEDREVRAAVLTGGFCVVMVAIVYGFSIIIGGA